MTRRQIIGLFAAASMLVTFALFGAGCPTVVDDVTDLEATFTVKCGDTPIEGATVKVMVGDTELTGNTDADGKVTIDGISSGTHTVEVEAASHPGSSVELDFAAGDPMEFDLSCGCSV